MKSYNRGIVSDFVFALKTIKVPFVILICILATTTFPFHVYIKAIGIVLLFFTTYFKYKDNDSTLIFLFGLTYALICIAMGVSKSYYETFTYILGPICFYCLGKLIVAKSDNSAMITSVYLFAILACCLQVFLNNIIDAKEVGIINPQRILVVEGSEVAMDATIQGLLLSLGIASIAYLIPSPKGTIKWTLYLLCAILSVFCVIHLVNRSGIFVLIITSFIVLLFTGKSSVKQIIFFILFLGIIAAILIHFQVISDDILMAYDARNTSAASSLSSSGGRINFWKVAITKLPISPLGWASESDSYFCHNMWLDIARCAGWLPLLFFIIINIRVFRTIRYLYKYKYNATTIFFIGLNVCTLISSSVEPVIEGNSTYFYMLFLIWGMQSMYATSNLNEI